ncbi:MAG TPA: RsmE family RNA methyltransferase [Candidatus Limnocylindrales bacterium]|nr:RsmE family RNA methyltransferase [Candidatus Limnocylindrales bacterium]
MDPESVAPDHLTLSPEESHHLLHVHRARAGTPFQAIDGEGGFYECVVQSVEPRAVRARIVERRAEVGELTRGIRILAGMPDWGAIEQIVALGVPLGVSGFDFTLCERSGRGAPGEERVERLTRIARAALKQSRRSRMPALGFPGSLRAALGSLEEADGRFLADPDASPAAPSLAKATQPSITLAVGPPGGFTLEERRLLLENQFTPISLGPSRLTTETAALALISLARIQL